MRKNQSSQRVLSWRLAKAGDRHSESKIVSCLAVEIALTLVLEKRRSALPPRTGEARYLALSHRDEQPVRGLRFTAEGAIL